MRAVRLLEYALTKKPEKVLDVGVGMGRHAIPFLGQGAKVVGLDVRGQPFDHPNYTHAQGPVEYANLTEPGGYNEEIDDLEMVPAQFDLIWCSHTLEHIPNVQAFLIKLRNWLKPGGWLMLAVPNALQDRIHVGHLTLWTPAHLVYNLICAGWDCSDALWYTDYLTIGLAVQKVDDIDLSWRTSLPNEVIELNRYTPILMHNEDGAWWGNNWPEPFETERAPDPPGVTIGLDKSTLPPVVKLAYGPNPKLREGYER